MALFLNVAPGETKTDEGLRLTVLSNGEAAWFHGKWLDLGPEHAVAWIDGSATFERQDGKALQMGDFPAWVARSKRRGGFCAIMFNAGQFIGGRLVLRNGRSKRIIAIGGQ